MCRSGPNMKISAPHFSFSKKNTSSVRICRVEQKYQKTHAVMSQDVTVINFARSITKGVLITLDILPYVDSSIHNYPINLIGLSMPSQYFQQ